MSDDDISLKFDDDDISLVGASEEEKKKRPSDPGKQFVKGVSMIGTELPAILGLAGAGLQAGWNTMTGDKGLSKNFEEALSDEGVDQWLVNKGIGAGDVVSDWLGIGRGAPVSTEDQIARNLGLFLPIPGLGLLGGASKLAKLAKGAAYVTTPLLKYTKKHKWAHDPTKVTGKPQLDKLLARTRKGTYLHKGNVGRAGAQLGIGAGIEQGIRGFLDDPKQPLMFSEKALTGEEGDIPKSTVDPPTSAYVPSTPEEVAKAAEERAADRKAMQDAYKAEFGVDISIEEVDRLLTGSSGVDVLKGGAGDDDISLAPTTGDISLDSPDDISLQDFSVPVETEQEFQNRIELDRKVQTEQDYDDIKTFGMWVAALAGSYGGIRYLKSRAIKKLEDVSPFGVEESKLTKPEQLVVDLHSTDILRPSKWTGPDKKYPGILNTARKDMGDFIREKGVDASHALATTLKKMGYSPQTIDHITGNSHMDTIGMGQTVWDTGNFGQGTGISTHAGRQLRQEYDGFTDAEKSLFDEGLLAESVGVMRQNAKDPNRIWKTLKGEVDLDEKIGAARGNEKVSELMDKMSDVMDAHLAYQVKRGTLRPKDAKKFKDKFFNPATSRSSYVPLYQSRERKLNEQIRRAFGLHTDKAREMDLAKEYQFRSAGPEGVSAPITPLQSLEQYTFHTIDHANKQAFHWQALGSLANIQMVSGKIQRVMQQGGKPVRLSPGTLAQEGRGTMYLGKGSIEDAVGETAGGNPIVKVSLQKDDPLVSRMFPQKEYSIDDLRAAKPDEIMVVHRNGELHAFHVPDAGIRAALDLNPQLGTMLQVMSHWKRQFTRFTTGDLSLFAPMSWAYSAQQVALSTAGREGIKAGFKTVKDSLGGSKELLATLWSKEVSDYLAHRIATNTGIAKVAPEWAENLKKRLNDRFKNSLFNQVRGESGRMSSSYRANEFSPTMTNFADNFGDDFHQMFPDSFHLVTRLWKKYNMALHEGPAYGAMHKRIGEALLKNPEIKNDPRKLAQLIREGVDHGKTVGGDVKRMGASQAARAFHASVPFSGAMVQSWNALYTSATHNGWKSFSKFTAGAGAMIGAPTIAEITYNSFLSPEHRDYYWNTLTTQQRNDNMVMFIPGRPPEEAAIYPISPEWSLFRAAIIDGADAIFGLSQAGNIEEAAHGTDKVGREHLWASLIRVLDVPIPPLIAAGFALGGTDLRIGGAVEKIADPDAPGQEVSFIRGHAFGQGERVTRRGGESKYVNDVFTTNVSEALKDLFGAGASLGISVINAYHAGDKLEDSPMEGLSRGAQAFGDGLLKSARYTQPLFGNTLRPKANDEVAKELFLRKENLKRLQKDATAYFTGALASSTGRPNVGNSVVPPNDPINYELSGDARNVSNMIGQLDKDVSDLRRRISIIENSSRINGEPVSIREKNKHIDGLNLEIQGLKSKQLASIIDYEERASKILTERYGRPVEINLSTFAPRTSPTANLIFRELRK